MAGPRRSKTVAAKSSSKTSSKAGARILIVEARYYDDIADALLAGAKKAIADAGAQYDVISVPGALEIPTAIAIAVDAAQRKRKPYDGAVGLGCVIRGETIHFDIVSDLSAQGLMELSVDLRFPIGNGIITVENEAQAFARARLEEQDKGGGAVRAALALIEIKRTLEKR
jgi:6,7-dimethyl-8-ribityllumazine synthase